MADTVHDYIKTLEREVMVMEWFINKLMDEKEELWDQGRTLRKELFCLKFPKERK